MIGARVAPEWYGIDFIEIYPPVAHFTVAGRQIPHMEQRWVPSVVRWTGQDVRDMTRTEKKTTPRKSASNARTVPLVVPHAGAGAGSDFESAFDVVHRNCKVHRLWQGRPGKQNVRRAS